MSSGLKMLHSDISPSKDNLIFSSMEDLQSSQSVDVETIVVSHNPNSSNNKEKDLGRNNSVNLSKSASGRRKSGHQRTHSTAADKILQVSDPEGIFQPKRQHQQNIILVQQQQQQKSILRKHLDDSTGKKIDDADDYEGIEEVEDVEGQTDLQEIDGRGKPTVVNLDDDEVGGRPTLCCWRVFREKRRLEQLTRRKQEERAAEFARLASLYKLEGDNKRILNLGWEELVQALQKRELSATAVLEAYIAKTLESTSKFNNVTEFVPQAFTWAKELDNLPEPKGPLHGIPFCVKDDHDVEGLDTSLGYASRLYQPAKENAVMVKSIMDLGGIPFCKTNVPQTLFTYGSENPVFGATTNPINPKLSPGGSSSGTGSLVGSYGCPFGTGTDIGGSVRIPAHFSGAAGIKPTVGRLSIAGIQSTLPNIMGLSAVPGIIGQTPTIVASVFKGICEDFKQHKYDSRVPPIPWDSQLFHSKEKLRIGYFSNLSYFPAMGDTEEVILRAKSTLESLGHELVPFNMPDPYKYMNVIVKFLMADGFSQFGKALKAEKLTTDMQVPYYTSFIPSPVLKAIRALMNTKLVPGLYSKRAATMFGYGNTSSKEMWEMQGARLKIMEEMRAEWERLELDSVICPLFPFPAPLIGYPGMLPMAVCYCMIWNFVDYPAGVVPFGRESGKNYDSYDDEGDLALKTAKKAIKESIGAPIAVQAVALPYKEEIVLRLLTELEQFSYKH